MLDRIRKNFSEGIKNVKWIANYVADRTKVETSLARLFYESSRLENRLDALYSEIGKRMSELEENGEKAVFKDLQITHALGEIKSLRKQIEDCKSSAQEINKPS